MRQMMEGTDEEGDAGKTTWYADVKDVPENQAELRFVEQTDVFEKYKREKFGVKDIEVVKFVEQTDSIKGAKDEETARWRGREPKGKGVIIVFGEQKKGTAAKLEVFAAITPDEGAAREGREDRAREREERHGQEVKDDRRDGRGEK